MSLDQAEIRAREFLTLAQVFLQAYRDLREPWAPIPPYDWPRYFLLCQSVELTLKAFLHKKGVTEQHMKRHYSHSLAKLFEAAEVNGLVIDQRAKLIPRYLSELHMDGWSRYPMPEDKKQSPIASVSQFGPLATALLIEVIKHVPVPVVIGGLEGNANAGNSNSDGIS